MRWASAERLVCPDSEWRLGEDAASGKLASQVHAKARDLREGGLQEVHELGVGAGGESLAEYSPVPGGRAGRVQWNDA